MDLPTLKDEYYFNLRLHERKTSAPVMYLNIHEQTSVTDNVVKSD